MKRTPFGYSTLLSDVDTLFILLALWAHSLDYRMISRLFWRVGPWAHSLGLLVVSAIFVRLLPAEQISRIPFRNGTGTFLVERLAGQRSTKPFIIAVAVIDPTPFLFPASVPSRPWLARAQFGPTDGDEVRARLRAAWSGTTPWQSSFRAALRAKTGGGAGSRTRVLERRHAGLYMLSAHFQTCRGSSAAAHKPVGIAQQPVGSRRSVRVPDLPASPMLASSAHIRHQGEDVAAFKQRVRTRCPQLLC